RCEASGVVAAALKWRTGNPACPRRQSCALGQTRLSVLHLIAENLNLRDVAIALGIIESIPDDELRLDRESDVVRFEIHFARFRLVEKRRGLHHRRAAALDVA